MADTLLSCNCIVEYEYSPPTAGDVVMCPKVRAHNIVTVTSGRVLMQCLDCSYRRSFSELEALTICAKATKHMINQHHRVQHFVPDGHGGGTMCLHIYTESPLFESSAPPR